MIELRHVRKEYEQTTPLADVSASHKPYTSLRQGDKRGDMTEFTAKEQKLLTVTTGKESLHTSSS